MFAKLIVKPIRKLASTLFAWRVCFEKREGNKYFKGGYVFVSCLLQMFVDCCSTLDDSEQTNLRGSFICEWKEKTVRWIERFVGLFQCWKVGCISPRTCSSFPPCWFRLPSICSRPVSDRASESQDQVGQPESKYWEIEWKKGEWTGSTVVDTPAEKLIVVQFCSIINMY